MEETEKAMLYYIIFQSYDTDLTEDDFTTSKSKEVITAVNSLKAEGKEVTMTAVKDKFKGKESSVISYLATLSDYVYGQTPEKLYNSIVEKSKKRKIKEVLAKAFEVNDDDADLQIQNIINDLNNISTRNQKEKTFEQMVFDTMEDLEDSYRNRGNYDLYTGLLDLDNITLGLHKGELTIIGARPRSRKDNYCLANSFQDSK
jgi:replicative DNA helicase